MIMRVSKYYPNQGVDQKALEKLKTSVKIGDRVKLVDGPEDIIKGEVIGKYPYFCNIKLRGRQYRESILWIDVLRAEINGKEVNEWLK